MALFSDLLKDRNGESVGERQMRAAAELPAALGQSRLNFWEVGHPVVKTGWRYLLGVAEYSPPELRLLDTMNQAILANELLGTQRYDVFSTFTSWRTEEDFARYIPGLVFVTQTPVLGVWYDGQLLTTHTGHAAIVEVERSLKAFSK